MNASKTIAVIIFLLITGCDQQSIHSESKDVVTDIGTNSGSWIFFADGSKIGRAKCNAGAEIFDRSTCANELIEVPAGRFFLELEKYFGDQLPLLETKLRGLYVRILRIDSRLLDLINTTPDPLRPDLRPLITAREQDLGDVDLRVADISDQIARIQRDLAQGEDPSLRSLLQDLNIQLADWKQKQSVLQQELRELRQQYITANASIFDQAMFNDLQTQRTQLVNSVDSVKQTMDNEMEELVQMHRTLKMLSDQGYVYELLSHAAGFPEARKIVAKFDAAFNAADLGWRTVLPVLHSNGRSLIFTIDQSARLELFQCRFEFVAAAGCEGLGVTSAGHRLYAKGSNFVVSWPQVSHPDLSIMRAIDVKGTWEVVPACRILMPSGAPAPWTSYDCTFRLQR